MNLLEAEKLAKELIKEHLGLYKWKFKWTHAKKSFGSCNVRRFRFADPICTIKLSKSLTELNDLARVKNTILHEIAHAIQWDKSGYMSHDYEWVKIAKSIGCDGERCYDGADVNTPKTKYTLSCGTCDNSRGFSRKPKKDRACGVCCKAHNNGKYSDKYKMILIEN